MRVLFATAEFAPHYRVGGLAEASSGLVKALGRKDVEMTVVLPDYGYNHIELADETDWVLDVPPWCGATTARMGVPKELADQGSAAPALILIKQAALIRPHPYVAVETGDGWDDNDLRFMGFSAAVAALSDLLKPTILHLNDWHSAATLGFLNEPPPTVLTVHTLGYQGLCSSSWLARLPKDAWRYSWYEQCNPLVGAIRSADKVIAVSPNYASEIVASDGGFGLHSELERRGTALVGIRNGIDRDVWSPGTDPHLAVRYELPNLIVGKAAARRALLERLHWAGDDEVLLGVVSRLVEQKGMDTIAGLAPFLKGMKAKLIVLGSGQREIAESLQNASQISGGQMKVITDRYDEPLAHQIFAGADLFLMPSRFEPCGLAQMQAMAYGTPTVATSVGGLVDTIVDADQSPEAGTGFLAVSNDQAGFIDAVHRAMRAIRVSSRRRQIQTRSMAIDWSWEQPAQRHVELYESLSCIKR